jgi:hypothetical protein
MPRSPYVKSIRKACAPAVGTLADDDDDVGMNNKIYYFYFKVAPLLRMSAMLILYLPLGSLN